MVRPQAAIDHLERSIELDPENADIQNETGTTLLALRRLDEAKAAFERAAALRPEWHVPLHNLAITAMRSGERDRALELAERAEKIGASVPPVRASEGMDHLAAGEFAEGWRGYEWRWPTGKPHVLGNLPVPLWDGSPLGERKLLLWSEQGLGDVLMFARFAASIPKERGRVILHTYPKLISLLATCPGIDQVIVDGDIVDVDLQFPLLSLPYLLNLQPSSIGPYLSAPAKCIDAEDAIEKGTALNVGILWASGKAFPAHAIRDCPLALFASLAGIPGVRLYSLQYGDAAKELAECPAPIVDLSPVLGDFHKTAAFVKRLDLIISVDTSLPHLAGALDAPVWTLIPQSSDWRWMREGDKTPWYPSMRLYRQQTPGDWAPVVERIARDLRELAADRFTPPQPLRVVHRKDPENGPRVFIKQYGEERTGSNYLRAAILANYADPELLIHLLGDKHTAPAPLSEVRLETASDEDPAYAFVATATFGVPAFATHPWIEDQIAEIRRVAVPLTDAFDRGELRYLISIKEPYAWAVSLAEAKGFMTRNMPLPPQFEQPLASACRRFNRVYAAWIALADAHPDAACIVRHEDVVRDPDLVIRTVAKQFALRRRESDWEHIDRVVLPAQWDGWTSSRSENPFDRAYYLERRYLDRIPHAHRRIIADTIDWDLFERFGYEPLEQNGLQLSNRSEAS